MKIHYCDSCDRLITRKEQTEDMFVDEYGTAYCLDCRKIFHDSAVDCEAVEFEELIQEAPETKRRSKSGFWKVHRRAGTVSRKISGRRHRVSALAPRRRS